MPKLVAPLDANNLKVINLATPTASADAATKAYVDAGGGTATYPPDGIQAVTQAVTSSVAASGTITCATSFPFARQTSNSIIIAAVSYTQPSGALLNQAFATPSGWTYLGSVNATSGSGVAIDIYWKAASNTSADIPTFTNGSTAVSNVNISVSEWYGVNATSGPYGFGSLTQDNTAYHQHSPQITTTGTNHLIIVIAAQSFALAAGGLTLSHSSASTGASHSFSIVDAFAARLYSFGGTSSTATANGIGIFALPHN